VAAASTLPRGASARADVRRAACRSLAGKSAKAFRVRQLSDQRRRAFRADYGTTPKAYLWQRRVALGVDLLGNTGLSLSAVAEQWGFRTAHHFSRRIKQATGLPPAALRRVQWDPAVTSSRMRAHEAR
jgi:AraC-like DNA-binding protein